MGIEKSQPLRSKWLKTKQLINNDSIKPFIPDTQKFNKVNLKSMITRYGMLYIKPEIGTHGMGVIKAEMENQQDFAYQMNKKRVTFNSFDSFHKSLAHVVNQRSYLIQRGIHLLKHNNRRFDIRVMVQLSPKQQWEATGVIGRLAHPQKIVTNYHNGGQPVDIHKLLGSHVSAKRSKELIQEMNELGLVIARHMNKKYKRLKGIGVDIGLDQSLKPWIIEVNAKPDPYIFNQLKDKRMYRKVIRYFRHTDHKP